ncbi:hypothetical protein B6E66_33730 [Streptomyces maremycinicus]|nr:hypothetical protein B6E66_33730 [Streptomyces sp. B9173]
MNGIEIALRTLHHGEDSLTGDLTALAERHRDEHEIHHVASDIARWSSEHVQRLADAAAHHGFDLSGPPEDSCEVPLVTIGRRPSAPAGHPTDPGLVLLWDLRDVHLAATYNSLHWEMLAQAARASHDARLLTLASSCHPRTLRQMRWTNTMIKNLSPQALTSL